jgi:geranylgeranyl pyrophosphate synthase
MMSQLMIIKMVKGKTAALIAACCGKAFSEV